MSETSWTATMSAEDLPGDATRPAIDHAAPQSSTGRPRRLLLKRSEAAEVLAMSLDSFERYVEPRIKLVILGRLRLVPYVELERYVSQHAVTVGGVL